MNAPGARARPRSPAAAWPRFNKGGRLWQAHRLVGRWDQSPIQQVEEPFGPYRWQTGRIEKPFPPAPREFLGC